MKDSFKCNSPGMDDSIEMPDGRKVFDNLFSIVYEQLRSAASSVRRGESHETINTTALVHEAWLKMKDSHQLASLPLSHFRSIAIRAMRQVLVEEARKRKAHKRDIRRLEDANPERVASMELNYAEILDLDSALTALAKFSPRQADIVERRFFSDQTVTEIATALQISDSAVERDLRVARAWLLARIGASREHS